MSGLSEVSRLLSQLDGAALQLSHDVRWQPLTMLMIVASAWWVKWPLFALVGALGDASRRRRLPAAALCAGTAVALAAGLVSVFKDLFDRARPPLGQPAIDALVSLPASSSFPSGHAATAFAGAVAVAMLHPRLRWPLLGLAAAVALSRVYLGVHYWSDILAGSALGALTGFATTGAFLRVRPELPSLARAGKSLAIRARAPE